jgi:hypothetical protein
MTTFSMPMNASWLGQMVVKDDPDTVSLVCLDRWARCAAVEAPQVEGSARNDDLLHGLGNQVEHLDAGVHREWQVAHIEGSDWYEGGCCAARLRAGSHSNIGGGLLHGALLHGALPHVHLTHAVFALLR